MLGSGPPGPGLRNSSVAYLDCSGSSTELAPSSGLKHRLWIILAKSFCVFIGMNADWTFATYSIISKIL